MAHCGFCVSHAPHHVRLCEFKILQWFGWCGCRNHHPTLRRCHQLHHRLGWDSARCVSRNQDTYFPTLDDPHEEHHWQGKTRQHIDENTPLRQSAQPLIDATSDPMILVGCDGFVVFEILIIHHLVPTNMILEPRYLASMINRASRDERASTESSTTGPSLRPILKR